MCSGRLSWRCQALTKADVAAGVVAEVRPTVQTGLDVRAAQES